MLSHADAVGIIARGRRRLYNDAARGQVAGAEYNLLPITNAEALPLLSEANRSSYPYDDIASFFTTKVRIEEMYLLAPEGDSDTWDDYIKGWEQVMSA